MGTFSSVTAVRPQSLYRHFAVTWLLVSYKVVLVVLQFCIWGLLWKIYAAKILRIWQVWYLPASAVRVLWKEFILKVLEGCALIQSFMSICQFEERSGWNIQYVEPVQIRNMTRETSITLLFTITRITLTVVSVFLFTPQLLPSRWYGFRSS